AVGGRFGDTGDWDRGEAGWLERTRIHCGSMPASLISLPQVASSDCTKAASVSGGPEKASNPVTAIFALESGSAMILRTSSFNRPTISAGVPAGANRPAHEVTS